MATTSLASLEGGVKFWKQVLARFKARQ